MIGKGDGFAVGPWRIAGRVVGLFRRGLPQAQVFEYAADDSGIINDGDDTHSIFTFWAFKEEVVVAAAIAVNSRKALMKVTAIQEAGQDLLFHRACEMATGLEFLVVAGNTLE